MCGIAGFVGKRDALRRAMSGLKRLEYRGYDSAGVAFQVDRDLVVERCRGRVTDLESRLSDGSDTVAAIAHTRWATHGPPTERNAHPHADCRARIAVVHNGIIENHVALRAELRERGHEFRSDTDTEVIAHLIEEGLTGESSVESLARAVRGATQRLNGSYAIAVLCADCPAVIVLARHESPLIVGRATDGLHAASDVPALIGQADQMMVLEDGDLAVLDAAGYRLWGEAGDRAERTWAPITLDVASAEKGGYEHYMLKEIHEEPSAVRETLRERLRPDGAVVLPELPDDVVALLRSGDVHFVACGTAFHAGLFGQRLFRALLRRRAEASVASEFRYDEPLVNENSLVVLISQSGETADTLAAAKQARRLGARTLAVVNCVGSSLTRAADATVVTRAGPEIGVASTKAYTAQIAALALLGAAAGATTLGPALLDLPGALERALTDEARIAGLAERLHRCTSFFFLGRGYDAAVAAEAALKLKEISYIHAEAYPAGEMKHGPLALIEDGVAVVGICTREDTHAKMASNLMEADARGGAVLAVVREDLPVPEAAGHVLRVPAMPEPMMPAVSMAALQLFAYHVAKLRGCAIDRPRNLAKSVTVE